MILLSGQLDRYNSRSGEGLLTFNIYEQDMDEYSQVIRNKTGQEYLIMLIPTSDSKELNEFRDETMEETTERFRRRMNALIQDIAVIRGQEKDEFREFIKAQLVGEGLIKKSTTELKIDGYAKVISRLMKLKHELETRNTSR